MSSPLVLILGHSFFRCLTLFLSGSHVYSSNFGLSDTACISLYGVGGHTVAKVTKFCLTVKCSL